MLIFHEYLKNKKLLKKESVKKDQVEPSKKVRKAGFAKGTITYIADDFDAPLDDLKDYM